MIWCFSHLLLFFFFFLSFKPTIKSLYCKSDFHPISLRGLLSPLTTQTPLDCEIMSTNPLSCKASDQVILDTCDLWSEIMLDAWDLSAPHDPDLNHDITMVWVYITKVWSNFYNVMHRHDRMAEWLRRQFRMGSTSEVHERLQLLHFVSVSSNLTSVVFFEHLNSADAWVSWSHSQTVQWITFDDDGLGEIEVRYKYVPNVKIIKNCSSRFPDLTSTESKIKTERRLQ